MGGNSSMGGLATPQTQATGSPQSGMPNNLQALFMGNTATNQPGGGQQLPQIMAPPRQPMPTMPQRTPMPVAQAPASGGYWDNLISQGSMRDRIEADPQGFARYWKHQRGQAAQMSPVERSRMRGGR